ncbi:hypothetical protein KAX03_00840 [Candidatus Bathyarchaeota archaeon]|nr:hypothetical protein [Candidatus Bathyarchaeota archaeon]
MSKRTLVTISIGAIISILGITYALYLIQIISDQEIVPVLLAFTGLWLLILAIIRIVKPIEYGLSPFSTAWWGGVILFGGTLWFLVIEGVFKAQTVWAVSAIAFGLFIIVAGVREWLSKTKKTK